MRVWVIKVGEPLPIDGARYRPHRIGMLSDELVRRGHDVTWWASTLEHASKTFRFKEDCCIEVREGFRIKLIHSMGYRSNVSLRRLVDHAQAARKFRANFAFTLLIIAFIYTRALEQTTTEESEIEREKAHTLRIQHGCVRFRFVSL